MNSGTGKPGLQIVQLLSAWKQILAGSSPMLSIETTRECPLKCPGCYAYGDAHLGGGAMLRSVSDYRGKDAADRGPLVRDLLDAKRRHPKLLMNDGIAEAILHPPSQPSECMFARMSMNYTADLKTRVEPCIFGGTPDCSQCGCAVSTGLHWLKNVRLLGTVKVDTIANTSMAIGAVMGRVQGAKSSEVDWGVKGHFSGDSHQAFSW